MCLSHSFPGVCVCRGSYSCSPSFPVMLRQVVHSCKCFVASVYFARQWKKKREIVSIFSTDKANARLIIFDLPAPTSVWCLNHVGPPLTGCCHWSSYKTILDFNRPSTLDESCWQTSNISSSKATHGWAVMYGSLFIFLFVYPCYPSCYIGRR